MSCGRVLTVVLSFLVYLKVKDVILHCCRTIRTETWADIIWFWIIMYLTLCSYLCCTIATDILGVSWPRTPHLKHPPEALKEISEQDKSNRLMCGTRQLHHAATLAPSTQTSQAAGGCKSVCCVHTTEQRWDQARECQQGPSLGLTQAQLLVSFLFSPRRADDMTDLLNFA